MSTGVQSAAVVTRPSEEIRAAQAVVRRLLVADDLLEEEGSLLAEFVRVRLEQLECELNELWGRQMQFEALIHSP
jgi:hypothetical protein